MRKAIILIGIIIGCISLLVIEYTSTDDVAPTSKINLPSEKEQTSNFVQEEQQTSNGSKDESQPSAVPGETLHEIVTEPSPSQPVENQDNSPQTSTPGEKEQFEVAESDNISGWYKLTGTVYLYKMEIHSEGMSWSELPDDKMTTFSFDFPNDWVLNSSVFNDPSSKVAEVFPVAEACITIDDIFQNYQPSVVDGEELISKELFSVNGYQCLSIISKNQIPAWYPHKYFISNGSYVFCMNFYSFEISESDQELFNKIISTFRFEDKGSAFD